MKKASPQNLGVTYGGVCELYASRSESISEHLHHSMDVYQEHAEELVRRAKIQRRNVLMIAAGVTTHDGHISIGLLSEIKDQDLSLLIDFAVEVSEHGVVSPRRLGASAPPEVVAAYLRSEQLREISQSHPGIDLVVKLLVEAHGVDALYKALEDAGRISFRDKRFGADLGL